MSDQPAAARVSAGYVADMAQFNAFIATKPTAEQFRRVYPDVMLVTPEIMTTREIRQDNSRFFPRMDGNGRIVGGIFQ